MEVFEITGFKTGLDDRGVNFLDPVDAFETINNGYIYRQELKSRKGFMRFGNRLGDQPTDNPDATRVMGIFENIDPLVNGSSELLVISKKYLYSYVAATGIFKQIPMNSAVAIGDFNITSDDEYVSGTTYLTKAGIKRFVFTGRGMSDVYFYNGTDVKRFTNTTDNPDYAAPASGALTKATKVHWFGERLNFFVPVIAGVPYHQGVLYSGIRDSSGKGDKFNVAGAGLRSADTYELMKGTQIRGDIIVMNFQRSNWTLQKTRDAFNPYFIKKVPSVLGTDATFSPVSYNDEVKSFGRTGMITTDGRQSVRFDNKMPYFTRNKIDPTNFELTYGGFDRDNSQFLFAYRSYLSTLSDVTQDKVLAYNYEESTFSIYDLRFSVFGGSDVGANLTWDDIDETYDASWKTWDTTEEIWDDIGVEEAVYKTLAGDNDGFIYQLNLDYDDYFVNITNITQAVNAVITVDASSFKVGDKVFIDFVSGMTEINKTPCEILAATDTSITVNIDTSDYTLYVAGGAVSKFIDFEVKFAPFNPYRDRGKRCYVSHIDVLFDSYSGPVTVDLYEDGEGTPYKKDALLEPAKGIKEREWITCVVDHEADFHNFVFKGVTVTDDNEIYTGSVQYQVIISSIRVYAKEGSKDSR